MKKSSIILAISLIVSFGMLATFGGYLMSKPVMIHDMKTPTTQLQEPCKLMGEKEVCLMSLFEHLQYVKNLLTSVLPQSTFLVLSALLVFFILLGRFQKKWLNFLEEFWRSLFEAEFFRPFRPLKPHGEKILRNPVLQNFTKLHPRFHA